MISLLRSLVVVAVAAFSVTEVKATPIYDCEPEIEEGLQMGMDYLKANWEEFEQRIQAGGQEIASCVKDRVFNGGTISCDIVECPMPGMVAWTYANHPNIYFCPWYVEERIEHLRTVKQKGACLAAKAANTFAISCKDLYEEHWDYYGSIFVDMITRDRPDIRVNGQEDCGLNRGLPFGVKSVGDKLYNF